MRGSQVSIPESTGLQLPPLWLHVASINKFYHPLEHIIFSRGPSNLCFSCLPGVHLPQPCTWPFPACPRSHLIDAFGRGPWACSRWPFRAPSAPGLVSRMPEFLACSCRHVVGLCLCYGEASSLGWANLPEP